MRNLKLYLFGLLLFISLTGYGQVKYAIMNEAGLITVDTAGVIDTVTALNTPPRVYEALLSQSSTSDPTVVNEFKNTLGGTVTWTYTSSGNYTGTLGGMALSDVFTNGKTLGEAFLQARGSNPRYYILGRDTDSTVILTAMNSSLAATDPATTNLIYVKITIYY